MSRRNKILVGLGIAILVVGVAGSFWLSDRYVVPIMMYHNVQDLDHHEANWVSPRKFEYHMAFLRKHNYNVISLEALVKGTLEGKKFPLKTVVVTFDDGKDNVHTNAFGILKKYNIPAIIFIPSEDMGTDGFMTADEIKEMASAGIAIGNHTRTQAYLPDLSLEKQKEEIVGAKDKLEEVLGMNIDYFAYPSGGFSDEIKAVVKQAGHKAACATNRGFDRFNKDVFELNRIRFSNKDNSDVILTVKLSGFYNLFRKRKNPY
jgi:peptidoglycan/xylan/chitin deacetylase (PgdA/CDA1 family)